jgi:hypothetical protein
VPALLAFLWCLFCATEAVADPLAQVMVRLDAPPECPNRAALDAELRRDLEGSHAKGERLVVDAQIQALGIDRWQALVRAQSDQGTSERTLSARNCQALVDATSLIIAMIIDPETAATNARNLEAVRVAPDSTANPNAGAAPASTAAADTAPATAKANASAPQRRPAPVSTTPQPKDQPENPASKPSPLALGGIVAAWAAFDYGSLPKPSAAFGGAIGLSYGPWRVETSLGWWWPRDKAFLAGSTAKFHMVAGAGKLCLRLWRTHAVAISPCAGVQAAYLNGTASGLSDPQSPARWDLSAVSALLGNYYITESLSFRLNLEALFPWNRPKFGFLEQGEPVEVFRPAQVQFRAAGGLELHFR